MKRSFFFLSICLLLLQSQLVFAADDDQRPTDTTYVYISPERLDVYPPAFVKTLKRTSKRVILTTTDGEEHVYRLSLIDSVSVYPPEDMPVFTSFKFNNKYNDQVFTDAIGEIEGDSVIRLTVSAIGKRLTPSFQFSDGLACAYIDGVRQYSKKSRLRFEESVYYTVARPGWQIIDKTSQENTEPEIPVDPSKETVTKLELTADMLSTNAPSNYPDREGLDKLLDDDLSTFFHSTWGSGSYEKLPLDQFPYIDIALPESVHHLQFSFTNRNVDNYYPLSLRLYASKNNQDWNTVRDFTVADDELPTAPSSVYQSPTIDLGGEYSYIRIEQTEGTHKNYLVWAELSVYKVTENTTVEPTPVPTPEPQDEELVWKPFGRIYRVSVDWPTDRSVMPPSIYIDTENSEIVSSKDYYLNATFSIDGAGVFPDMEETPVQIKGRGNSSWSTPSYYYNPKNPYRLKFDEKQKPFGLTKGKSWVLQANKQTGSMMVNGIGMKAGHLMGAVATNHVVPVELYMNGEYRGSYIFNEKLGFSNNSIDLDDESVAVRIELDSYSETGQFRSDYYSLPVNIKEPDFYDETTITQLTKEEIVDDFNAFVEAIYYDEDLSPWVDADYLASFLSVNELVGNYELMHPKSTFLYKENLFGDSKYIFGPVWDLDWAYGYEGSGSYYNNGARDDFYTNPAHTWNGGSNGYNTDQFWKKLRYNLEAVDHAYYRIWTKFMTQGGLDELLEFCDDYFNYANPSFIHNVQMWGDGNSYSSSKEKAKKWLSQRANYIYSKLTPYDLTGELDESEEWAPSVATLDNDDPEDPDIPDAVARTPKAPTRFTVYDLRGMLLKRDATFNTWREGLAPGIYIVNGKKVLVP